MVSEVTHADRSGRGSSHADPDEWKPIFVLPNIALDEAVDGGIGALVPINDERLAKIVDDHPRFGAFLTQFTDAFGQRLQPCTLLLRRDAPTKFYVVNAVASFRDLIALSVVLYARAQTLLHPHQHRTRFANSFAFYPWMLDRKYDQLLMQTIGHMGVHDLSAFTGQSSPEVFVSNLHSRRDFDIPLLEALIARWGIRYSVRRPTWDDTALFRSLNMAYQASHMPATVDFTHYDFGRSLALWVSAFEILAHPGRGGRSSLNAVYLQLERVQWIHSTSGHRRYASYSNHGPRIRRPIASWLYGEIYQLRNAYLHGNQVDNSRLAFTIRTSRRKFKRFIFDYVAPLYRLALTSFLDLRCTVELPSALDAPAYADALHRRWLFNRFQQTFEEAIHTSRIAGAAEP